MTATRRVDRWNDRPPYSPMLIESERSSRSPIRTDSSWRSFDADAPPSTTLTMDASQMVLAACSPHLARACEVVSNKVLTVLDGRWRSLDGRPVFSSVTGLSAHYNALLADRLSREIGIEWELRQRGVDHNPQWEVVGVSDALITEFSSRTREIELKKDELIAAYVARHGRMPTPKTIVELRAQATLATRPPKGTRSLTDLTAEWRRRASARVGADVTAWAAALLGAGGAPLTVDDVPLAAIEAIGADVVAAVEVKRAVWNHWNLLAEASKQTMDLRFATTSDREAVVSMVVDAAQGKSVSLTPPELAISPVRFQREDGTSLFRPRHSAKYSSTGIIEAEARLLARSEATTAPTVRPSALARVLMHSKGRLSSQQRAALESLTTSGRQLDLLVGPAGAGKTTTMRALRSAWIVEHGQGSVIGLAPSATAAQALADDLGVACDNTAKWLHEYDHGRTDLRAGQLVIIDEATLAGTTTLDRISGIAEAAGAKVLLVGDPYQLQPVEAGGAFALLVDRRTDAPELTDIHRFANEWERHASLALRRGEVEVISTYVRQKRIREGLTDEMLDRAYEAWRADCSAGKASILVTESSLAVRTLNERARAERLLLDGAVDGREVPLAAGKRLGWRCGDHPTQRAHCSDLRWRLGQERRPLAGGRHPPRRLCAGGPARSATSGQGGAATGVRRGVRRPRLRRHRTSGSGHNRRHRPRRGHTRDDPT
jgi:hypothetical protein